MSKIDDKIDELFFNIDLINKEIEKEQNQLINFYNNLKISNDNTTDLGAYENKNSYLYINLNFLIEERQFRFEMLKLLMSNK